MNTQKRAWQDLQPSLSYKQNIVLDVIKTRPSTLFEISARLDWPINSVSGRVTELRKAGKVLDSTWRRTNPNSGKSGIVWIATVKDPYHNDNNNGEEDGPIYNEDGRQER